VVDCHLDLRCHIVDNDFEQDAHHFRIVASEKRVLDTYGDPKGNWRASVRAVRLCLTIWHDFVFSIFNLEIYRKQIILDRFYRTIQVLSINVLGWIFSKNSGPFGQRVGSNFVEIFSSLRSTIWVEFSQNFSVPFGQRCGSNFLEISGRNFSKFAYRGSASARHLGVASSGSKRGAALYIIWLHTVLVRAHVFVWQAQKRSRERRNGTSSIRFFFSSRS
jgi:hypothetical protein